MQSETMLSRAEPFGAACRLILTTIISNLPRAASTQ
jgi:hypothetical protein